MHHDPSYLTVPQLAALADLDLGSLRLILKEVPPGVLLQVSGKENLIDSAAFMKWLSRLPKPEDRRSMKK